MADWLDLPHDLLERISSLFIISDPRISPDFIRMRSVCKSWRSILKYGLPRELPWLMMLPNNNSNKEEEEEEEEEEDDDDDEEEEEEEEEEENPPPDGDARLFYSPSNQKIHTISLPEIRGKRCCGSFQNGWLMIVDDKLDIFLFHPWSKKKIDLPHQSTFKRRHHGDPISSRDLHISKAALSDDLKIVVIIYIYGFMCFWRMGDVAYTDITAGIIEDVIYHKGQFYALSQHGSVFLLHIGEGFPPSARVEKLTVYLVEPLVPYLLYGYLAPDILTDSIFVITRNSKFINDEEELSPHITLRFDIFRVSLEGKRMKSFAKVESLGDRALFLGYNSSMIVMASQFPGCKGNHIYFADNIVEKYYFSGYGCSDLGVFSLESGTVEELFTDRFHPIWSPPLWIATPPYSSLIDFGGKKLCFEEPHVVST